MNTNYTYSLEKFTNYTYCLNDTHIPSISAITICCVDIELVFKHVPRVNQTYS